MKQLAELYPNSSEEVKKVSQLLLKHYRSDKRYMRMFLDFHWSSKHGWTKWEDIDMLGGGGEKEEKEEKEEKGEKGDSLKREKQ